MKQDILNIIDELDKLNYKYDYKTMNIALILWLSSNITSIKKLSNDDINTLYNIMDILEESDR